MAGSLRDDLVEGHRLVFDGLLEVTADLGPDGWVTPTGCPGWDVSAQLAHCIGLERVMLGEPMPDVEVPDLPHIRDDYGRVIERDIVFRRGRSGDELRAEAREVFDRRLEMLDRLTDEDLDRDMDAPIGRVPAKRALRTRIFDLVSHESDIRRALGHPRSGDGPHVRFGVGQILRAWAVLLPKRLDDRPVLTIAVIDQDEVTLDLAAGEVRSGHTGDAVATVTVTVDQLLALGGGRSDAPAPAELPIAGDRHAAEAVLAVATITP